MSKRAVEPTPAAREFDEQPDDDLDEEEGGASFENDDDDDGDLWDSPDEDADEEDEGGEEEGSEAEPREASGRDTEIADGGETPGSPLAERTAPPDTGEPFAGMVIEIAIRNVIPDPDQPRLEVDTELADSIKAQGVLQPIVVRRDPTPGSAVPFMLVDGERRWRAAREAGLDVIPARVVSDVDDAGDRLLHQVTFNEGKRLAPMEEAKAWARIMAAKGWNIQQIAAALGRAKSTVSDRLAILDAPAAFQPLFDDGTLTAAAAPIVRTYATLPDAASKMLVQTALRDYGFRQHVEAGRAVPLEEVKNALERTLSYTFARIDKAIGYDGAAFEVKGVQYAVDRDSYYRAADRKRREIEKANQGTGASGTSGVDWQKQHADEERKRRERTEKTRILRRAQFDAIAGKIPSTLDDKWSMLLVEFAVEEMQQLDQSMAAKAVGIDLGTKSGHMGYAAEKAIIAHAKKLSTSARVKLLLQLLIASDLQVSEYGAGAAERINAAAKVARVDLKKVKAPDPAAGKKPAAKAKTKPAKKGGRR